jgi:PEP-CTERM motif
MLSVAPHMRVDMRAFKILFFTSVVAATQSLPAANVSWDTPAIISSDTDVSNNGTLVYAYTFGASGVPAVSVDGVTFESFGVPTSDSVPVTVGNVSLAVSSGDLFFSNNFGGGDTSGAFASLSEAFQNLLRSGVSTSFNNGLLTLTLGGLTIGQRYEAQFWSSDSNSLTGVLNGSIYTSGNAVTLDNNSTNDFGGVGQWVLGTFVADADTQLFFLTSDSPANDWPILNAMQLRVVPEPSTWALLGLGAAVVLWQIRRRVA